MANRASGRVMIRAHNQFGLIKRADKMTIILRKKTNQSIMPFAETIVRFRDITI